ncbi:MAG TPA: GNAT family N-acetyltransferase [Ignavibacteriaceae bacterium]|nr:GNAT family N-acetyltransferase [Ignavibacteriaceae bacterium]
MLEYFKFDEKILSPEEWDNFVDDSDNGTMFSKRRFLSYHAKNKFNDKSFYVTKDGKLHSIFTAALIEKDGIKILSSHPGASFGGFVYKSDFNFKEAHDLVDILFEHTKNVKADRIQLTISPMIYQTKYSNYLDFALVRNGFQYLKREVSSVVQLDFDPEQLLNTYRAEARTATKKALKKGVEIVETERFDEYYDILKKNLKLRHGVNPAHTLEELKRVKSLFPSKIRLWGAFLNNIMLAGVCNFSVNRNVVLAFYISHDEAYQEYRPVNLLFYEIMKRYQTEGFRFLDFGIFTVAMEPNWGLGRFKENFGARGIFRDTFYKDL